MGRVVVEFVVSNYSDLNQLELGNITPDKVRRVVVSGVVDTGAARLVLPEGVVKQLGLPVIEQSAVRFADHRRAVRVVVKDAYVELLGRGGMFKAIVEPNRSDALLGAIVMEDLDLIVDCSGQKLMRREPDMLLTEVE
jgi:predicted aspartyl protease